MSSTTFFHQGKIQLNLQFELVFTNQNKHFIRSTLDNEIQYLSNEESFLIFTNHIPDLNKESIESFFINKSETKVESSIYDSKILYVSLYKKEYFPGEEKELIVRYALKRVILNRNLYEDHSKNEYKSMSNDITYIKSIVEKVSSELNRFIKNNKESAMNSSINNQNINKEIKSISNLNNNKFYLYTERYSKSISTNVIKSNNPSFSLAYYKNNTYFSSSNNKLSLFSMINGHEISSSNQIFNKKLTKILYINEENLVICGGFDMLLVFFSSIDLKEVKRLKKPNSIYEILKIEHNLIAVGYYEGIIEIINVLSYTVESYIETNSIDISRLLIVNNFLVGICCSCFNKKYYVIERISQSQSQIKNRLEIYKTSNELKESLGDVCVVDKNSYCISLYTKGLYLIDKIDHKISHFYENVVLSKMVQIENNIVAGFGNDENDSVFRIYYIDLYESRLLYELKTCLYKNKFYIHCADEFRFVVCGLDEYQLEISFSRN